jgi:hypothetical protein
MEIFLMIQDVAVSPYQRARPHSQTEIREQLTEHSSFDSNSEERRKRGSFNLAVRGWVVWYM